jgi:GTP-binding protein HflX
VQWKRHKACPGFENEELYRQFDEWQGQPTVEGRRPQKLRGSRKRPHDYQPRQPIDRRRLDRAERERLADIRPERAVLVQVVAGRTSRNTAQDSLEELARLADTVGAPVAGTMTQRRPKVDAAFCVGEGKLGEIQTLCREHAANLVVFDNELSPAQVNKLDRALGIKVIDRTELILQIFARRASSEESQAQVELAQLQYMENRVPDQRQPRFGAGIGMRGPGETPLQMRKAAMRHRIKLLKQKLERIRVRRDKTRKHRALPSVCLVGYTNAGKSTLLNALTRADAYVDDRPFATLDTTTRLVQIEQRQQVLVSDTVGFIRHLPHRLVASFRSTLEEVTQADMLIVVADAADPYVSDHLTVVDETLEEVGARSQRRVLVLNKSDTAAGRRAVDGLQQQYSEAIAVSARQGTGLQQLKRTMLDSLAGARAPALV